MFLQIPYQVQYRPLVSFLVGGLIFKGQTGEKECKLSYGQTGKKGALHFEICCPFVGS